jgi:hypothetical protein
VRRRSAAARQAEVKWPWFGAPRPGLSSGSYKCVRCRRTAVFVPRSDRPNYKLGFLEARLSKQLSQYPESGYLEQRKCTRALQAAQRLKSLSGVPTRSTIIPSPSTFTTSTTS